MAQELRGGGRSDWAMLVVVTIGFACARFSTTSGVSEGVVDHSPVWIALKLAKALIYVALACVFYRRDFSRDARVLGVAAAVLFVLLEVAFGFSRLGGPGETSALLFYIAASSANDALVMFLYLMAMACFKRGPWCLFAGFAANYLMWLCAMGLPEGAQFVAETGARLVGTAVAVDLAFRATGDMMSDGPAPEDESCTHAAAGDGRGWRGQLTMLAVMGLLFSTIAGFYLALPLGERGSALSGEVAVSLSALLCLGLAIAYVVAPRSFDDARILFPAVALCLGGCLLMPICWESEALYLGVVALRLARLLAELCTWALALRLATYGMRVGAFAVGVVLAASTYYVGVPLALVCEGLFAGEGASLALQYSATVVAVLMVLCAVAIAQAACPQGPVAGQVRHGFGASAASDFGPCDGSAEERLRAFDGRFMRFAAEHGFSEREMAVLVELVHGHSGETIGGRLGYSRDSVKFVLAKVYAKAGVANKQELLRAIEETPLG